MKGTHCSGLFTNVETDIFDVFDTRGRKEDVQVPELRKMDQVVANNEDCAFI